MVCRPAKGASSSPTMTMAIGRRSRSSAAGVTGPAGHRRAPARPRAQSSDRRESSGIDIASGAAVSGVETSFGGRVIEQVRIAPYRSGKGRIVSETKIACDFVAVSGGYNPALHLWCHNGGKIRFDEKLQSFRPDKHFDRMRAVGAANGEIESRPLHCGRLRGRRSGGQAFAPWRDQDAAQGAGPFRDAEGSAARTHLVRARHRQV